MSESIVTTVTVSIPGTTASRSKAQKKGWKCWCKNLTKVATPANNGFAYEGEFVSVGSTAELTTGDVLLHVDDASSKSIGVVMRGSLGAGFIHWMASTSDDKWAGSIAKPARTLLAMDTEDRIRHVAAEVARTPNTQRSAEGQAYWDQLAGIAPATVETPANEASPAILEAIASLRSLIEAERSKWTTQGAAEAINDALGTLIILEANVRDINDTEPVAE